MDPSVQFLGIDWERVSGRCFSLSMHANILESILLDDSKVEIDNLVLINKMLRDLAAIEADVLSHSEAVLRGRLSKSQRQLILDQQVKYASISSSLNHQVSNYQPSWKPFLRWQLTLFYSLLAQVSKSRSFRDTSGKSRPSQRAYRKNKTTHLDKLTTSMSAHTIRCSNSSDNEDDNLPVQVLDKKTTVVSIRRKSSASSPQGFIKMCPQCSKIFGDFQSSRRWPCFLHRWPLSLLESSPFEGFPTATTFFDTFVGRIHPNSSYPPTKVCFCRDSFDHDM